MSDPDHHRQIRAVEGVLDEILVEPRPTTLVLNKIDLLDDPDVVSGLLVQHSDSLAVSARTGEGLDALRQFVWGRAAQTRKAS